jgi:hypothetical protein
MTQSAVPQTIRVAMGSSVSRLLSTGVGRGEESAARGSGWAVAGQVGSQDLGGAAQQRQHSGPVTGGVAATVHQRQRRSGSGGQGAGQHPLDLDRPLPHRGQIYGELWIGHSAARTRLPRNVTITTKTSNIPRAMEVGSVVL